jgi:hypothetical protein
MNLVSWLTNPVLLSVIGLLGSWAIIVFVRCKFSPALQLRLQAKWIDAERIVLHIEVENKSQVRVTRKSVKLQIIEYPSGKKSLTEWVPFASDSVHAGEDCEFWRDPIELFQSNRCLYPGEVLTIERIEHLSSKDRLFHVGLQFKSKSSVPFLKFILLGHNEQWTTTAIFVHKDREP